MLSAEFTPQGSISGYVYPLDSTTMVEEGVSPLLNENHSKTLKPKNSFLYKIHKLQSFTAIFAKLAARTSTCLNLNLEKLAAISSVS